MEICIYCNLSTSFGSGRFVNRIWAVTETKTGFMCEDCQKGSN